MTDKKRRRRKDARPDEIIDAALEVFAEKGFSATSMANIAARADIARSTIYLYFDDKEALILSAFQDRFRNVVQHIATRAAVDDAPIEEILRHLFEGIAAQILKPDTLVMFKILLTEGNQFPDLMRRYHATVLQSLRQTLKQILANGVTRGEIRPEILDFDEKLIIAPVVLAAMWQLTFQQIDPIDVPRFVNDQVTILTRGILT